MDGANGTLSAVAAVSNASQAVMEEVLISEAASMSAFAAAVVCSVLGTAGNGMTMAVLLLGSEDTRTHAMMPLFLSLALSDLIFSTFNLPLLAARFYARGRVFSSTTCHLFPVFYYSNVIVSVFSMTFIAIYRFVGVNHPNLAPDIFTRRRSWLVVLAIWAEAVALLLFPFFGVWGRTGYVAATFSCTILPKDGRNPTLFLLLIGTAVPFAATVASYCLVCFKVRRHGRDMREAAEDERDPRTSLRRNSVTRMTHKRERQLNRTVTLVCVSFLVCFLPAETLALVDPMPPHYGHAGLHVAAYVLFWCSAFVNPLIYTVNNTQYRKELGLILDRCLCRPKVGGGATWYVGEGRRKRPEVEFRSLRFRTATSEARRGKGEAVAGAARSRSETKKAWSLQVR